MYSIIAANLVSWFGLQFQLTQASTHTASCTALMCLIWTKIENEDIWSITTETQKTIHKHLAMIIEQTSAGELTINMSGTP